jgi:hypothetical protein
MQIIDSAANEGRNEMKRIILKNKEQMLAISDCHWGQEALCPETHAWIGRDKERLRIRFEVMEADPVITYHAMNEPVYKDSCVEFFLQPLPGQDDRFLNFEMNADATLLLGLGTDRHNRLQLQEEEADGVRVVPGRGVDRHGQPFWSIELSISFSWLKAWFPGFEPVPGANMRANFYKCGDEAPVPHYGSWNPMADSEPDFHRSEDFGEIELA